MRKTRAVRQSTYQVCSRSPMSHRQSELQHGVSVLHPLLRLQQSIGNRAVGRLIQAQLTDVVQQERGGIEGVQRKDDAPAKSSCGSTSLAGTVGPSDKRLNGSVA